MSFFNHPNISFLMFPQFEITPSYVRSYDGDKVEI